MLGIKGHGRVAGKATRPARYGGHAPPARDTWRAMSQENLEIVRAAIDAFNRRDVDAAFKDADPDFQYDQTRAVGMDRGVFNLDEFRDLLTSFTDSWESFTIGADELIDAGENVVMPFTNSRGAAMESRSRLVASGFGRSATARSCGPASIRSATRPSKPPGCRSRPATACLAASGEMIGANQRSNRQGERRHSGP